MFASIHKIDESFHVVEHVGDKTQSQVFTKEQIQSYFENKKIETLKMVYFDKSIRYDMDFEKIMLEYNNFPVEARADTPKEQIAEIIRAEIEVFLSGKEGWYLTASFK